ncbi:aconitate hydratase AcnA [Pyrofollis japonicus]|uniref:aconitate hydratase AcnA n=1 Tax=Pyrofollis japonicus TaxID=3060460 RepID=UPI00295B5C2C|nr:aconitate hydratase AcnA [Pyrofollis japonicus]BEP18612.1 aconitate hydratase AcnA [Pyrofollis japonicus]
MSKSDIIAKEILESPIGKVAVYRLDRLEEAGLTKISRLPYTIRILLENVARNYDGKTVTEEDVRTVASWPQGAGDKVIPFMPSRAILQDYTGVPAVVDLAAMRDVAAEFGCNPRIIDTHIPAHLIIDHSISVDYFGTSYALYRNMELEFKRYKERYRLLKWAQQAFGNLKVVPPGKGIIHQVNIEYLAKVVMTKKINGETIAYPDSVIGADSHTTMINGIGVLGWGAGGIEVEAVMLGQPYYMILPEVIGVKLVGEPREGVTPTDIVLAITEFLRKNVETVGRFVEFYGPGLKYLLAFDRATIANMAPEYGSTTGFFPVDEETLAFLRLTGRDPEHVRFVEWYTRLQHLFYTDNEPEPEYSIKLEFDLSSVEPSIAGPAHPDERVSLKEAKKRFREVLAKYFEEAKKKGLNVPEKGVKISFDGEEYEVPHGAVAIAAITSCTNTSNPHVMIGAGLVAKKAVERGLTRKPWVKTSLSPGSRVVVEYLRQTGLSQYLEALGFHVVGFGCMTCIGNSGPLIPQVEKAIREQGLFATSVLSGNRNFLGRVHPLTRGNYLASPMLVVAYALKGTIDWDPETEPIDYDPNGEPVYLKDIWPSTSEIKKMIREYVSPDLYKKIYKDIYKGTEQWEKLEAPSGDLYAWDPSSTFIQKPPFFEGFTLEPPKPSDIIGARVLVMLGDKVTTDHISPAGPIPPDSPAGKYLIEHGVKPSEFGTYGARRGNHEVMMRGTFANPRIKNLLVDREGGYTIYWPTGEIMTVYDAAMRYKEQGIPLIVIAGKRYGAGSSRDWAAKGPYLLGVKAVIAESFERIHRSNLVGMGILPLQFMPGQNAKTLGLRGDEVYDIIGISEGLEPRKKLKVIARRPDGTKIEFEVVARLDNWVEVEYYKHSGILHYVLRNMIKKCLEQKKHQK